MKSFANHFCLPVAFGCAIMLGFRLGREEWWECFRCFVFGGIFAAFWLKFR